MSISIERTFLANCVVAILPTALLVTITVLIFPREFSLQQKQFSTIFLTVFITLELLLFLLPKKSNKNIAKDHFPKHTNIFNKNVPWNIALMVIGAFGGTILYLIGLAFYEPTGLDPFHANINEIKSITIRPSRIEYVNLLNKSLDLTEKKDIKLIVDALNTAIPIYPNHPGARWECDLILRTKDDDVTINISNTKESIHGVLVYWWSPNINLNLGERRCDKLGPVLEQYAKSYGCLNSLIE